MIAYCGLDCSKCDGYLAAQSGEEARLKEVAEKWSKQYQSDIKPEHIVCDGCKAGKRQSFYCSDLCKIRNCCVDKNVASCIECSDFACEDLKVIIDNAPDARENLEKLRS